MCRKIFVNKKVCRHLIKVRKHCFTFLLFWCGFGPRPQLFIGEFTFHCLGNLSFVNETELLEMNRENSKTLFSSDLVELMVWVYAEEPYRFVPSYNWDRLAEVFPTT